MPDPLGLIGTTTSLPQVSPRSGAGAGDALKSNSFKEQLVKQINDVNQLQQDAKEAVEDLATGRRDDVESVIIATQKADTAFRMLLQVRNKVMNAYDEVKQIRV